MRKDISKILVERPRIGGGFKYPKGWGRKSRGRGEDRDDLPSKESIRRKWIASSTEKFLNENLRPLERFLEKQVGRPWDKVFSEICANLRVDNAVQKHVRDHLPDFVTVTCRRVGRKIYGRCSSLTRELSNGELYVDPRTGILRRYEVQRTARKVEPTVVPIDARSQLHKLEGIWYAIALERAVGLVYAGEASRLTRTKSKYSSERILLPPGKRDLALRGHACFIHKKSGAMWGQLDAGQDRHEFVQAELLRPEDLKKRYGDALVFGVSRKQAPSKLLKRFGVRNDEPEI